MNKKIILLFILIPFLYSYSQNKIYKDKTPEWVDIQNYNRTPDIDEDEITNGNFILLADYQINTITQEYYFRLVTKITDNVGIQSASNVRSSYDPLYQKLIFHNINIIRGNKIIDKLSLDYFQIMRRELNAENFLYDGSLSAILNLSDVRNGDIIDISYTTKGFNPIHNGNFSDSFTLTDYSPVGKINVDINTNKSLNYKLFNTDKKPTIAKNNSYTNYNWSVETPKEFTYEEGIPTSNIVMPTVIVSTYKSWKEVAKWAMKVYSNNEVLNKDVKNKIKQISETHKTEGEKIKAILNFVQNDIRYLGLEYGISSYKPNSPNKVFNQRFGDCKDKSLLMVKMLDELNIEAYPMLLNTSMKSSILNIPASPKLFDHCVVKVIDKYENELYYDPTLFNQGGTYRNTHFPNYEYGFIVKKNHFTFDTIVSSSENKIKTHEEFIIHKINGDADLTVINTYSDVQADRIRNYFLNNSKKAIRKEYEDYYLNFFDNIKILDDPLIQDDKNKNELRIIENYKIDSIWKPMKLENDVIGIEFTPTTLKDILTTDNSETRENDIALPYPVTREHSISIKLPTPWSIKNTYDIISNDFFYYDFEAGYRPKNNEIILKYLLKTEKAYVSKEKLNSYNNDVKKASNSFGYTVFVPKEDLKSMGMNYFFSFEKILFSLILIGTLIFIVYQLLSVKSKKNH